MKKQHPQTPAEVFEAELFTRAAKTDLGTAALVHVAHELDHNPWMAYGENAPVGKELAKLVDEEADHPETGLTKVGEDEDVELVAEGECRFVRYSHLEFPDGFYAPAKRSVIRSVDVSSNPAFAKWTLNHEQSALIQHALSAEGFQLMASPNFVGVFYVALPSNKVAFAEIKKRNRKGFNM